jgi:hypothetical protein
VYPEHAESTVTRATYDAALQQAERASRLAARVEALETVNAALLQALLRLPGGAEAVAEIVARVAGL